MREVAGIRQAIEILRPHWPKMQARFEAENDRFLQMMAQDHDERGRLLKCHLVVENYMDRFLKSHLGLDSIEEVRLTFFQKAMLLPNRGPQGFVKGGILELNTARNFLAHVLDRTVDLESLRKIRTVLTEAREGQVFRTALEQIEAFTAVACTFLLVPDPEIKALMESALSGVTFESNERA